MLYPNVMMIYTWQQYASTNDDARLYIPPNIQYRLKCEDQKKKLEVFPKKRSQFKFSSKVFNNFWYKNGVIKLSSAKKKKHGNTASQAKQRNTKRIRQCQHSVIVSVIRSLNACGCHSNWMKSHRCPLKSICCDVGAYPFNQSWTR